MSEWMPIGQRMREHLLASDLFTSVHVERDRDGENLVLILVPRTLLHPYYERILRFCLNVHGERKQQAEQRAVFHWYAAYLEDFPPEPTHACRIWVNCRTSCGYTGFDALCHLMILSFRLVQRPCDVSQTDETDEALYHPRRFLQRYQTTDEVLAAYERLITQVIEAGDDLPTRECDPSLQAQWLCCPKHRFLFVQRLLLHDWLHHLLWRWEPGDDDLSASEYLLEAPLEADLYQMLISALEHTLTTQQWLEKYFAHLTQREEQHWERPLKGCQHKHHIAWLCCSLHIALNALSYLYSQWAVQFDLHYHVSDMEDEHGVHPHIMSNAGIALLIKLAGLDIHSTTFPGWHQPIPFIDVGSYYRPQKNGS